MKVILFFGNGALGSNQKSTNWVYCLKLIGQSRKRNAIGGKFSARYGFMIYVPFLYFLVIFGVIYLLAPDRGPDCLERAERYAEGDGGGW